MVSLKDSKKEISLLIGKNTLKSDLFNYFAKEDFNYKHMSLLIVIHGIRIFFDPRMDEYETHIMGKGYSTEAKEKISTMMKELKLLQNLKKL